MPGTRETILHLLKTKGPQSAATLAERIGVTPMAVRQHLATLEAAGDVAFTDDPRGVGRPVRIWNLTEHSHGRFPDSHGELAVGILDAVRSAFGEPGIAKLIKARTKAQVAAYKARMPSGPLDKRVAALARIRTEEGYMAEWRRHPAAGFILVENHCPVCAAAQVCQGLCDGELELFRRVLGRDVHIKRTEHILTGARRCAYRIR